jgi:hypothetical protein
MIESLEGKRAYRDQAALLSRGSRALHVPDDREQRRNSLSREAHHRDGRSGVRADWPA